MYEIVYPEVNVCNDLGKYLAKLIANKLAILADPGNSKKHWFQEKRLSEN
jgi:hypothetical protein